MKEDLLQYIWQYQLFDRKELATAQGQVLKILKTGTLNENAGPDFSNAHILIDDVAWHGHVEIHVNSAAWYAHKHQKDKAYESVVLHVVWEDDKPVIQKNGTPLPTIVLQKRIKPPLLARYGELAKAKSPIPCATQLNRVPKKVWNTMIEKALFQRLESKHNLVYKLLKANKDDSEATAYQLLAYNFGFKLNSEAFLTLSKQVPLKLIQKNATSLLHLEALLLGQAGLLPTTPTLAMLEDDYVGVLTKTYTYLKHKYKLKTTLTRSQWNFFRLRPANFPFIRIAQFANLLHTHRSIFYLLINTSPKDLQKSLSIRQSTYWQEHYILGKKSKQPIAGLGKTSIDNIIINTVVPILVAYGKIRGSQYYIDRAIKLLHDLPPEHNTITNRWKKLGMKIQDAFNSQGSLELFNSFCKPKKCLSCAVGIALVRGKKPSTKILQ